MTTSPSLDVLFAANAAMSTSRGASAVPGDGPGWQRAVASAGGEMAEQRADARRLMELQDAQPRAMSPGATDVRSPAGTPSPFTAASSLRWASGATPSNGIANDGDAMPPRFALAPTQDTATERASIAQAASFDESQGDATASSGDVQPDAMSTQTPAMTSHAGGVSHDTSADRIETFDLPVRADFAPVRIHVQWRGRIADVWIGLHREFAEHLPAVRAQIDLWLDARGGTLGRLTCNGDVLETRAAPYLQGDL
jgi:hypothetical protein